MILYPLYCQSRPCTGLHITCMQGSNSAKCTRHQLMLFLAHTSCKCLFVCDVMQVWATTRTIRRAPPSWRSSPRSCSKAPSLRRWPRRRSQTGTTYPPAMRSDVISRRQVLTRQPAMRNDVTARCQVLTHLCCTVTSPSSSLPCSHIMYIEDIFMAIVIDIKRVRLWKLEPR